MITYATGTFAQVTLTATVGTASGTFTTLKAAFDAINAGTHQGAIVISINGNTAETAACVLNSTGAGAAIYTSVLIKPTVDGLTISGATATGRGLIELNGADNVTIDGDNPNTAGTNRNLTITNTAANTITYTSVIRIALNTTTVASADNNIFRNLIINGSATGRNISTAISTTGSENTTYGILAGANALGAITAPTAIISINTTIATPATATNLTITNNAITTASRGIAVQGETATVFPGLLIDNNSIGNATTGAADGVYAIGIAANGSASAIISNNTIYVEGWVPASASNAGIQIGTIGGAINGAIIEKNKVNRVQDNSTSGFNAWGINLATGNNHVVRNNFVSGVINVPNFTFSTTFGAHGIRILAGTGHFIYHNSVNMTGNLIGSTNVALSSALCVVSTLSTGMDIRNNILSNTQTLSGAAVPASSAFVSLYLPSGATVAMNLTNNNNDYFTGAAVNQGVGQAGTTAGTNFFTLANFDPTMVSPASNMRSFTNPLSATGTNDNASKKVDPIFVSATDLHIQTSSPMESQGATVAVTTDIDGDARGGVPDIGADEIILPGPGTLQFSSTSYGGNEGTIVTITVNRVSGVTGAISVDYATSNVTAIGGATCSGATDYLTTSGTLNWANGDGASKTFTVSLCTDLITDPAETVNLTLFNAVGTTITGTNPAVIAIGDVPPPFNGTYTVGTGGNYPSLTNNGGIFEAINLAGAASGNIIINIISDLSGELGTNVLNEIAGGFSVLIKPTGAARTINGTGTLNLIKLSGADGVTIDGSLNGGTDKSLNLIGAGNATLVWIATNATSGANNNTLKNCILSGSGVNTLGGVIGSSGTTLGGVAEFPNSNNTIQNNTINRVQFGVAMVGNTTIFDQNWVVTQNSIGSTIAADKVVFNGIFIAQAQNFTISKNEISGINSSTTSTMSGIRIGGTINGGIVVGNKIRDIHNTNSSGFGSNGINLNSSSAAANVTIANNFISDISSVGFAGVALTDNGYGIMISSSAGYKIYNNSISLSTNQVLAGSITAAINIAAAVTTVGGLDIRNNILSNTETVGTVYAIYNGSTAGNTIFSNINYNNYFAANIGFLTSGQVTLANWQTATGQDVNSINVAPAFVNAANDLHLVPSASCVTTGKGVNIAAIVDDIDMSTRNTVPFIGAHEAYEPATAATTLFTTTPGTTSRTYLINGSTDFLKDCQLINKIVPSGAFPVSGSVVSKVTIDASVQTYNLQPYVQRHYDIEPAINAANATATVTLYFKDIEFVNFNNNNLSFPDLPTVAGGGNSDPKITNIKVNQFHGTGTAPGNYTGLAQNLTPTLVNYNTLFTRWEITVSVTGFSGFYVHTNTSVLPIVVNYLQGTKVGSSNSLNWEVTCTSSPSVTMTLERSNSSSFTNAGIYSITADNVRCATPFNFIDNAALAGINYYRLRIVDAEGKLTYSNIIALLNKVSGIAVIGLTPNPVNADGNAILHVASAQKGVLSLVVSDIAGKKLFTQTKAIIAGSNAIPLNFIKLAAGTYHVTAYTQDGTSKSVRFVKQ